MPPSASSAARSRPASNTSRSNSRPPKYDWRELQRWGISESSLPAGSEIMFRDPTIWETYRWQLLLIAAVILVQAGLISGLLHERRRRRVAEVESRQRLAELAHANRYSAVGELTTSIAHELNQPLGSILTNAETAELMLKGAVARHRRNPARSSPTSGATTSGPAR